jgi:hypothetical protein
MPSHVILVLYPNLRTVLGRMHVHDGGGGNGSVTAGAVADDIGGRVRRAGWGGWGREWGLDWLACVLWPGGRAITADAGGTGCAFTHGLCVRMNVEACSE